MALYQKMASNSAPPKVGLRQALFVEAGRGSESFHVKGKASPPSPSVNACPRKKEQGVVEPVGLNCMNPLKG